MTQRLQDASIFMDAEGSQQFRGTGDELKGDLRAVARALVAVSQAQGRRGRPKQNREIRVLRAFGAQEVAVLHKTPTNQLVWIVVFAGMRRGGASVSREVVSAAVNELAELHPDTARTKLAARARLIVWRSNQAWQQVADRQSYQRVRRPTATAVSKA